MSADIAYLVDMECLLCGRLMGSVQLESMSSPIPYDWLRARCAACGGQSVRGEALPIYVGPKIDMGRMRVGRPPKWLTEA